jgi:hypothetical protein
MFRNGCRGVSASPSAKPDGTVSTSHTFGPARVKSTMRLLEGIPRSGGRFTAVEPLGPPCLRDRMTEIPEWRRQVLRRLDVTLILFELVLSVIFLALSLVTGSLYFKGVGIGLVIAWVTSAVAVLYRRMAGAVA